MNNEFSVAKAIEDTEKMLRDAGMPAEDAQRQAEAQVNSMGATKTLIGTCPRGRTTPMACMFCPYGHMMHCHYPLICDEAKCSHYQAELEPVDEDQASLFKEGCNK